MKLFLDDTIVAPATKVAKQAISIIRLSGPKAFEIVNKLLNKNLEYTNKQQLRKVYIHGSLVDESLFVTFVENKSFTGENVIEINCHGGILLTNKIISETIKLGARMAEPGEFMKRAYMNGKISLIQAEGINNLIESKNELSLQISAMNMSGSKNKNILWIKEQIMDLVSRIQTSIDYPDYDDIEGSNPEEIKKTLAILKSYLEKTITISKRANTAFEGIKTLIIGEPNVGKSSILNAMINEEKAIVTDIEGTTRDIVEGQINFPQFTLKLIDTAGIRKTDDVVEKLGIQKSIDQIELADLVLFVVNDKNVNQNILDKIKNKKHIIVVNKKDLLDKKQVNKFKEQFENAVFISAIKNDLEELEQKIHDMFNNDDLLSSDLTILTNLKNITSLENILQLIDECIANLEIGFDFDILSVDLYKSLEIVNSLLGIINSEEEIIDNIFKKYCLGK
ncbi:tRNA modification GTPase TrmE [Spiroplasma helicoides]|uniref:tRNA modification GTPase MnmE n=1 Tax=Spiroplasma helicoides TaxID=216938 RepID=A0A1B3SME3_9MOLU|nr:tRNA uridine-5-carboxymethylaminomethyl(34) synthesis GTPase MnmE [Spiroplasma helicoides]AOG61102.1 tRNA modification GTPase TrmE [Spiroplasma helicoides]